MKWYNKYVGKPSVPAGKNPPRRTDFDARAVAADPDRVKFLRALVAKTDTALCPNAKAAVLASLDELARLLSSPNIPVSNAHTKTDKLSDHE